MTPKNTHLSDDVQSLAEQAAARGDWQAAAEHYARLAERRAAELALINSVQEGLSSKLDMQSIYDLVGDSLRDTFNAGGDDLAVRPGQQTRFAPLRH